MCVFWGRRKRIKSVQHQKKEHFSESEKSTLALFPLFLLSKRRQQKQKAEGASFFHLFFCASFSTHCSLFFLSLLSLSSFLSLFSQAACCVFLLENSLHTNNFLAAAQAPIIILIFPLIIKVNTTTRKARFT